MLKRISALDGKHIAQMASGSGIYFYNYKGYNSQILMALVNAKYRFLYYNTGSNGLCNDAAVFNESALKRLLEEGQLNLPEAQPLPRLEMPVPYYIVAFGLKTYLMKPYPYKKTTDEQRKFNKRLSSASRFVECAFGHLASRFQVFSKPMRLNPDKAENITRTAVLLHNYLIDRQDTRYNNGAMSQQGSSEAEVQLQDIRTSRASNASTKAARKQRDEICAYINRKR